MSTFGARNEYFSFHVWTWDPCCIFLWRYSMVDPQRPRIVWHLLILQNFHDLYYFLHCTPFLMFNGGQDQSFESTDSQRTSLTGLRRMVCCPGGVGHALGGPYQTPETLSSVLCRHRIFSQSRAAALDPGSWRLPLLAAVLAVVARSAALTHVMQVDGICTRAPGGTVDAMTGVPRDAPAAIEPNVT